MCIAGAVTAERAQDCAPVARMDEIGVVGDSEPGGERSLMLHPCPATNTGGLKGDSCVGVVSTCGCQVTANTRRHTQLNGRTQTSILPRLLGGKSTYPCRFTHESLESDPQSLILPPPPPSQNLRACVVSVAGSTSYMLARRLRCPSAVTAATSSAA